jgi:cell division transport system permease protein
MTILVIGITIALPSGLLVLLNNAKQLQSLWEKSLQMSVFIQAETSVEIVSQLQQRLVNNVNLANVEYLSALDALQELAINLQQPGLLAHLDDNPLPITLVATFKSSIKPEIALDLKHELEQLVYVQTIDLDSKWLERSSALINLLQQISFGLVVFLCCAVVLIIGNTIRLAVKSRSKTISIAKLIGATNSFIRREFLYLGFWHGFLGGISACVFINLIIMVLNKQVVYITKLYENNFALQGLNIESICWLLLLSTSLGILGAWMFTEQHIRKLDPV